MHQAEQERGFTLIELMISVAIIGILSAVGIPALTSYMNRSKASEATIGINHLYNSVRLYRIDHNHNQFPESAPATPVGGCCASGAKCSSALAHWTHPSWKSIDFYIKKAHYYQYEIVADNSATPPTVTVYAYGDLDCNGVTSTYQRQAVYQDDEIREVPVQAKFRPYE